MFNLIGAMGMSQFTHYSVNLGAIYKQMWVFMGIYLIKAFQSLPVRQKKTQCLLLLGKNEIG